MQAKPRHAPPAGSAPRSIVTPALRRVRESLFTAHTAVVALGIGLLAHAVLPQRALGQADDYARSIETWRSDRDLRLRSANGWLTVVALEWLSPGENRFGSSPNNPVHLPGQYVPEFAGTIEMTGSPGNYSFTVQPSPDAQIMLDEAQLPDGVATPIRSDKEGEPSTLGLGQLRFWVVERGDRAALRVRDPQSSQRTDFRGIETFPIDSRWRLRGTFVRFPEPSQLIVPNIMGHADTMFCYGKIEFELNDAKHSLLPMTDAPDDSALFVVFGDATNGNETYGAGRFLTAPLQPDGSVDLDFNKSYNPPCAFNQFTTCPLPPQGNVLSFAIPAGEKAYIDDSHEKPKSP